LQHLLEATFVGNAHQLSKGSYLIDCSLPAVANAFCALSKAAAEAHIFCL